MSFNIWDSSRIDRLHFHCLFAVAGTAVAAVIDFGVVCNLYGLLPKVALKSLTSTLAIWHM
jgi:hypothetical protein